MPKQARLRGIKALHCYTIAEAAALVGVTPRTIRSWARGGLRLLDSTRPVLIRGDALRDHIIVQRQSRKVKTAPDEFYCFGCRGARPAAGHMADCMIRGHKITLTALCATCQTAMSKPVSRAALPRLRQILDLQITETDDRI